MPLFGMRCQLLYQCTEEVLETGAWYFRDESTPWELDITAAANQLLNQWAATLTNWRAVMADNVAILGIGVQVPEQGFGGAFTMQRPVNFFGTVSSVLGGNDLHNRRYVLTHTPSEGRISRGGIKIAGAPEESILGNVWKDASRTAWQTALNNIFVTERTIQSRPWKLGIPSRSQGFLFFLEAQTRSLDPFVSTDITRRWDRAQRKGKLVPSSAPVDPDPEIPEE